MKCINYKWIKWNGMSFKKKKKKVLITRNENEYNGMEQNWAFFFFGWFQRNRVK